MLALMIFVIFATPRSRNRSRYVRKPIKTTKRVPISPRPSTSGFVCNGYSSGKASFYDVYNAAENDGYTGQVSCGGAIPKNGLFVAVSSNCFIRSVCGKSIVVTYKGKSISVPILDECATCDSSQIDLSIKAWKMLESNLKIGVLKNVQWR